MTALLATQPTPESVLTKAFLNAGSQLGLNQADLADVLGVDRTAISRLKSSKHLDPRSKQGELALLLIRFARALHVLTGGDKDWMQHFMCSPNLVTGGIPREQIKTIGGLMAVVNFVDAMRGKV